ncbi:hypothetical protein MMC27_005831 [Xylographa pallens]|nr:hypothetical protein [Xylographa pallens]
MDPLSISSGIAGLLSLAVSIAQVSFEYVSCVKDAPKAIRGLIREVACLEEVLRSIRNELLLEPEIVRLRAQRMEDRWFGRDALLQECEKDLHALLQELQNKVKAKKIKILDRAVWYFNEDGIKAQIGLLCRYRDQFTALTSQDILAVGTLTLKEVRAWREEESNKKILCWLSPLDFAARHQDISSKRQPETLRWVLASAEYRTWSRSDVPLMNENRVLWCYGDPGAGKTYVSSRIIDHLFETSKDNKPGIAYVYCDYDDQNYQTLSNILGCILKQLTMQCAALPDFVDELYQKEGHKPANFEPAIFWKLLQQLSENFPQTFIIVDALDELENDKLRTRKNLLRVISTDRESKSDIRVFATSRPHLEDINNVLCAFPKLLIEARDNDMRSFLLQRIEGFGDLEDIIHNDKEFKAEIIETLVEKANKLFLIPALHIDRLLESTSRAEIEETLENITGTIGDAYASTLSRIQNLPKARSDLALDTLMWLSHSKRPLRFAELQEALAVRIGSKNINRKAYVSAKIILSTCLGLINIESDTEVVRLKHPTLEEYLKSSPKLLNSPAVRTSRILLTYMRFPELRTELDDKLKRMEKYTLEEFGSHDRKFPFLNYSSTFWRRHTMVCQRELEPDILDYFRLRPYIWFSPLDNHYDWGLYLYLFRQLRNSSISGPWIELVYAIIHLFGDVVLQLIKRGVAFQAVSEILSLPTALSWLSLLSFDIMGEDRYRWKGCRIELDVFLQNILKQGLTTELHWSEQETLALLLPFVSAETMDILLDCGFDVNWPCKMDFEYLPGGLKMMREDLDCTAARPIHIAARFLATTAIKFLTQHGADCNMKTKGSYVHIFIVPGQSPLRIMMERLVDGRPADLSGLEVLLQAGSNVNEILDSRGTALHFAIGMEWFSEPLCELLAVNGAQISAVNNAQATPLKVWVCKKISRSLAYDWKLNDWRACQWLLRHGASLSELGDTRCQEVNLEGLVCSCREMMRALASWSDEHKKAELQDTSHDFEPHQNEWLQHYLVLASRRPYVQFSEAGSIIYDTRYGNRLSCRKVLLDWLKDSPSQIAS